MEPFRIEETWLECIGCGYKADLLAERHFKCPKCGNLYEVRHDIKGFMEREGYTIPWFKDELNHRTGSFSYTDKVCETSGVWRYMELIMPYLGGEHIVSLGEGIVPILRAGKNLCEWIGGDIDLWLILEGMTPTGSFKDFGGTVMMSVAKAAGVKAVACASTGDTSAMAAAYAAAAGLKCAVILPRGKVTAVQLAQPLVHGAKVITLPGDFDDCMKVMQNLVADCGVYPANSLNPSRIEGHQATIFQLAHFFNWELPNWVAVPVGNGSNASSIGKGIRLLHDLNMVPQKFGNGQILGCQSEAANPLARSWSAACEADDPSCGTRIAQHLKWKKLYEPIKAGETTATAARIGNPVSWEKVMMSVMESCGAMATAKESDLNKAVSVCGKDGIFVCPQTGTALAGIREAVREGWIKSGDTVVAVSTATGLKFTESAAKGLEKEIIDAPNCDTDTVAKLMGL